MLHEKTVFLEQEHSGIKKLVPLHSSECRECGSDIVDEKQASLNKRLMTEFYKEADGLLTGEEIKRIRKALHLTQSDASKIFGGGSNAFTKYENDDVTQSVAMDKLMRLAVEMPEVLSKLSIQAGVNVEVKKINWLGYSPRVKSLPADKPVEDKPNYIRRSLSGWSHSHTLTVQ
ncbi:TPA: type II toxin-antitoxin system MqsA family antitoxin [Citrobacter braakii]|nr:type II toxin-antitoxin system MqsA family antitoxin [Citrobacter braakii]